MHSMEGPGGPVCLAPPPLDGRERACDARWEEVLRSGAYHGGARPWLCTAQGSCTTEPMRVPVMKNSKNLVVHRRAPSPSRERQWCAQDRMVAWHAKRRLWPAKLGQEGAQQGFEGSDEVMDTGGAVRPSRPLGLGEPAFGGPMVGRWLAPQGEALPDGQLQPGSPGRSGRRVPEMVPESNRRTDVLFPLEAKLQLAGVTAWDLREPPAERLGGSVRGRRQTRLLGDRALAPEVVERARTFGRATPAGGLQAGREGPRLIKRLGKALREARAVRGPTATRVSPGSAEVEKDHVVKPFLLDAVVVSGSLPWLVLIRAPLVRSLAGRGICRLIALRRPVVPRVGAGIALVRVDFVDRAQVAKKVRDGKQLPQVRIGPLRLRGAALLEFDEAI